MNRKRLALNGNGAVAKLAEHDFIGSGFKKLDDKFISARPPKIKWGKKFLSWPVEQQLDYAKKLACTMNHAAHLVQLERDNMNQLLIMKEKQLEKMTKSLNDNNAMIQQQVAQMNSDKQQANKHAAAQNKLIKELRDGNIS